MYDQRRTTYVAAIENARKLETVFALEAAIKEAFDESFHTTKDCYSSGNSYAHFFDYNGRYLGYLKLPLWSGVDFPENKDELNLHFINQGSIHCVPIEAIDEVWLNLSFCSQQEGDGMVLDDDGYFITEEEAAENERTEALFGPLNALETAFNEHFADMDEEAQSDWKARLAALMARIDAVPTATSVASPQAANV